MGTTTSKARTTRKATTTPRKRASKAAAPVLPTAEQDKETLAAAVSVTIKGRVTTATLKTEGRRLLTAEGSVQTATVRLGLAAIALGITSARDLCERAALPDGKRGTCHNAIVAGRVLSLFGEHAAGQESLAARFATREGAKGVGAFANTGARGAAAVAAVTAALSAPKPPKPTTAVGGQGGEGQAQGTGAPRGFAGQVRALHDAAQAVLKGLSGDGKNGAVVTDAVALEIATIRALMGEIVAQVGADRIARVEAAASVESPVDATV